MKRCDRQFGRVARQYPNADQAPSRVVGGQDIQAGSVNSEIVGTNVYSHEQDLLCSTPYLETKRINHALPQRSGSEKRG
jgi:hypothetical protein